MGIRKDRMADQVRDILAGCFAGSQVRDPRLQGLTVTHVRVSPDLQLASVYYRLYDEADIEASSQGLERCRGFLKKQLAKNLQIRRVPNLRFFYDESIENGSRIEALISAALR